MKKQSVMNIIEASKQEIGTKFKIECFDGELFHVEKSSTGFEFPNENQLIITDRIIDAKFILIQQPVSFMEAIKANQEGKVIKVNIGARTYTYYPRDNKWFGLIAKETLGGLSTHEILEGKWYIEESEED
ncbi:hypothetical protein [Clostridium sp. HBUAS56017]|uniref:hypothetical protein n=1 Tax=Clostridium sp. HBUAS56017 TaxID=2571128 RepID=UPI001177537B|nr:hypothetical protein [Clostridium sp. HBUAS56017]